MKIDVIGDVHGCINELHELFQALGYQFQNDIYTHPEKRLPVFVGDITDRGPDSIRVIQLVYKMVVQQRKAKYVPGNHCNKLYRYFLGNNVKLLHGIETTVEEYEALESKAQKQIRKQFMELYKSAPLYLHFPELQVIVAHAGMKTEFLGRSDNQVKSYVLYGDVTGRFDDEGRPIRKDWAKFYKGKEQIIYGHTPVKEPRIINNTVNIDTGCVFGNALSAFRIPEQKVYSVPSQQPLQEERFRTFD